MDKKPGDILKNALLPPSQQSHEAVAKAFAESEANFVRMSFETTLQTQANQPVKQEMIDTIVASTYKLLYRKAMRLLEGKPISNQQEDHEDLQAIQELGPVLVVLRGLPHRPLSRGDIAIKALKLKREGLKFSEATDQICDCGQNDHDESCRESIRQARMRLERLLKKHKVNLP